MPAPSDSSLIQQLQALDRRAISQVYDTYFPELYRYAFYRLGNEQQAEDLASEVFVRLLDALNEKRGPKENLKGWLFSTAAHMATDQMRKKYRRPEEELPETLRDASPSPAAQSDERETNRSVQAAYQTLTPEQQEVIALRFGQGYSLEEAAQLMKKNVNAIKALQFRALAAMQRVLGEVNE